MQYVNNAQRSVDDELVSRLKQDTQIFYSNKVKPDIRRHDGRVFGLDVEIEFDGQPVQVFVRTGHVVTDELGSRFTRKNAFAEGRSIAVAVTGVDFSSKRGHYIEASETTARHILLGQKIREWNNDTWILCTVSGNVFDKYSLSFLGKGNHEVIFKVLLDDSGYHFLMQGSINLHDRRIAESSFKMPAQGKTFYVHPVWRNLTDAQFHAFPVTVSQAIPDEWWKSKCEQ